MAKLFDYICTLFWALLPMICGLFLYTNGFFLKRNAITERSNCSLYPTIDSFNFANPDSSSLECLKPRARIVLLVVDALKFEFADQYEDEDSKRTFYRNKLPIISETLKNNQKNSKLLKFIADPPTTTMQRLKSLSTGTLPTFIDVHDNFAADNILEDNFIDLNMENGNIFMGDDTWTSLYPKKFRREYAAPSFDVSDLDTVDLEVKKWIFKEIAENDWSLLVAHTLGVDHCGHKHGKNHPEMLRKLNETNFLIHDLIKKINQVKRDTIFFVIGDHGMTDSGDHGGDSTDEVEAAMFIYSTLPLIDTSTNFNIGKKSAVNQIDIVPTISAILGIPIPFSNIGNIILEAIPSVRKDSNSKTSDFIFILHSLWKNIYQIQHYIDTYSSKSSLFEKSKLSELKNTYNQLLTKVKTIKDESDLKDFVDAANDYFTMVRKICYEAWVQFEPNLMAFGLVIFLCAGCSLFIILSGLFRKQVDLASESSFLKCVSIMVLVSQAFLLVLHWLQVVNDFENTSLLLCGFLPVICFMIRIIQKQSYVTLLEKFRRKITIIDTFSGIVLLTTVFGVFSNSYIVDENKILCFFLLSQICFVIYSLFKNKRIFDSMDRKEKVLICLICLIIKGSSYFWRYREEQKSTTDKYEEIEATFVIGKAGSIISTNMEIISVGAAIVLLGFYVVIMKIWLRTCGNLSGYSPIKIIARFIPELIVVATACYWIPKMQHCAKLLNSVHLQRVDFLPLIIYALFIIAILSLFYWPLAVHVLSDVNNSISIHQEESLIPKLYHRMKNVLYNKKNENENAAPTVWGLGTVYSACYILLVVLLSLAYALLLGFVIAPSVILMNVVCLGLLYITAVDRIHTATNLEQLLHVPNRIIFCWFLIAEYFFYATGHQPSFSTIHWDAGFIGIDGALPLNFVRAILIGFNTFGSHVILGVALPLLVLAPFTLLIVFPSLVRRAKTQQNNAKQGELIIFQNANLFQSEIFSVTGKYILYHAARVFVCMVVTAVHRRHLMVWSIFAPKLIFEGLSFLVTAVSILTSLMLLLRIESCIEKLILQIT